MQERAKSFPLTYFARSAWIGAACGGARSAEHMMVCEAAWTPSIFKSPCEGCSLRHAPCLCLSRVLLLAVLAGAARAVMSRRPLSIVSANLG